MTSLLAAVLLAQAANLNEVPPDLRTPPMLREDPAPGKRVRLQLPRYEGTDVHHALYLPTDWRTGGSYPVIVEYAGNGGYKNALGDVSHGTVDGSNLGFGLSGGKGYLWLCLPYVDAREKKNATTWWGDVEATAAYCKEAVAATCASFGGDRDRLLLAGFSRGAIACNFIGLHDDGIAPLWRAFFAHSHYDGVLAWPYPGSGREAARTRLARLGSRPQWISHERSVDETRTYLEAAGAPGRFTFAALPFPNHSDAWVLRDLPLRAQARAWLASAMSP